MRKESEKVSSRENRVIGIVFDPVIICGLKDRSSIAWERGHFRGFEERTRKIAAEGFSAKSQPQFTLESSLMKESKTPISISIDAVTVLHVAMIPEAYPYKLLIHSHRKLPLFSKLTYPARLAI